MAFSSDGKTLALAGYELGEKNWTGFVHLLESATGKHLRSLNVSGDSPRIDQLALSSDGKSLAVACDLDIHLLELSSGKFRKTLKGHDLAVRSLVFSADGKSLISADLGGSIFVWKVNE